MQPQPEVPAAVFRKIANDAFPGGDAQIAQEAAELAALLRGRVSQTKARDILVHAKGRILIALRSHNLTDGQEAFRRRCVHSILMRSPDDLDQAAAEDVVAFACRRLIAQLRQSSQDAQATLPRMTKEEALLVARVTAFRLARHMGRTDPQVSNVYDLDPKLYIASAAQQLLAQEFPGRPKKIDTQHDALKLCLNVAETLALAAHVEANDTGPAPDSKRIDRLARQELELTLSLVRKVDEVAPYRDFDASEARAAQDLQIPFAVALRLGQIGLLRDPPGPNESRRRSLNDALRRLRDA